MSDSTVRSSLAAYDERCRAQHIAEVANGEHDDQCEVDPVRGYGLCHCPKRRREAAGHTTPPGDLLWAAPSCPRCYEDVWHDGDGWQCNTCHASWNHDGTGAEFTDDHGDLSWTPTQTAPRG